MILLYILKYEKKLQQNLGCYLNIIQLKTVKDTKPKDFMKN